jgi:hypothetical protein
MATHQKMNDVPLKIITFINEKIGIDATQSAKCTTMIHLEGLQLGRFRESGDYNITVSSMLHPLQSWEILL